MPDLSQDPSAPVNDQIENALEQANEVVRRNPGMFRILNNPEYLRALVKEVLSPAAGSESSVPATPLPPLDNNNSSIPYIPLPHKNLAAGKDVYVQIPWEGGSVVADLGEIPEPRPAPKATGTPFAVCTRDGTFVGGDITREGNPPSLEAVQGAARKAFEEVRNLDPKLGDHMTPAKEDLRKALGKNAEVTGLLVINGDPRCNPGSLKPLAP